MAIEHPSFVEQPYQGPMMSVDSWQLAFYNALPKTDSNPPKPPLIFAHGARFNWDIWRKTGTLAALQSEGFRTIGIDLPPGGNFSETRTRGSAMSDPVAFFSAVSDRFRIEQSVGVFPSQSAPDLGYPIVRRVPHLLAGAVFVAPIRVEVVVPSSGVPSLIVWGDQDTVAPPSNAEIASIGFTNSVIARIDSGSSPQFNGHAPYIDRNEEFNQLIAWFSQDPSSAATRIGEISLQHTQVSLPAPR